MTAFNLFYDPIRAVLGDRQVHGLWMYPDATIDSALRALFAFGKGPDGYTLDSSFTSATGVVPDVAVGDAFAIVCCEAALMLITGEDGAMQVHTRAMTVRDEGHRKRDLLRSLEQQVYQIRGGDAVFVSVDHFAQFLGLEVKYGGGGPDNFSGCRFVWSPRFGIL